MKNMKFSVKIGMGFGILILIACFLGSLAIWNMKRVESKSVILANEHVPEVEVSNQIERSSLLTMYNIRGYAFSQDENYLELGRKSLEEVKLNLKKAEKLAEKSKHLVKLKESVKIVEGKVQEYERLVNETETLEKKIDSIRNVMDKSAAELIANCSDYIMSMKESMNKEIADNADQKMLDERLLKIITMNEALDIANTIRVNNFKAQVARKPELIVETLKLFSEGDQKVDQLKLITRLDINKKQVDAIKSAASDYRAVMTNLLEVWQESQKIQKIRQQTALDVLEQAKSVAEKGIEETAGIADEAKHLLSSASLIMVFGLIAALLIGILIAFFITRSIANPLLKGVGFVQCISEGDLTVKIDIDQKDEVGILVQTMRDMVARISSVIEGATIAANNVATGSQQLSSSAQEMSEGASEQAAAAEELSSSMEQMAGNIQQNADHAMETEKIALKSADDARESGSAVNEMVDAMRDISEKIQIIDDIARQTDLLALNAAIEAARAGDGGRGFAVVASEVRKLAERSQVAAGEISKVSVSSIKTAEKAGDMISKLIPDIQRTAELVQEISAACNEQNTGSNQINKAIQQLDQVIQQNTSVSEEMASTSEELAAQAEQLRSAISFFKIGHIAKHKAGLLDQGYETYSERQPEQKKFKKVAHIQSHGTQPHPDTLTNKGHQYKNYQAKEDWDNPEFEKY